VDGLEYGDAVADKETAKVSTSSVPDALPEGEISLSDTLPTATVRQREPSMPDGQADTPPAGVVRSKPE
jgi:hypothetical protein